ncbi:hypothetical protein HPHPP16_0929 [Helicobacter pylori Hp P-16]|uniref:Uncharacterized protein n=1 Tax=Helicobacter pylori NQ4044 TaxID=992028 RepID=J0JCW4_HELPX|nr:hypothetical protein [Helicobacter pylori]EJB35975.1 hypothetical protein HPNQ4044_1019 [Helicobacter pylori NQ4044]EJC11604.1 hypothetical protein HPHPP16_0929 [Helicobacter pylori Hp P-16]
MDKNRVHAIIANAVESGGSFSPIDRVKFVQFAKMHGIEYSVIEEVIDITQTISLIHSMKIGLMQAICQENRRKPCALIFKKALMKI